MNGAGSSATLSVVVPNYNHGHFLPACLDSILSQSWQPDEIVVIDDASTDSSVEVIRSYLPKCPVLRLVQNERNRGVLHNLNWALREVKGQFLYCPAADDVLLPGQFEHTMRLLSEHPQAALCCGIGDWREESTGWQWYVGVGMAERPTYFAPADLVRLERSNRLFIAGNTAVVRRQAILEAGGYIGELKWHCDWFALHVAGFRHGIGYVPECLARFNILPGSFYQRGHKRSTEHEAVLRHMVELLCQPGYQDAAERIREAGSLYLFGWPMFRVLRSDPRFRRFLTPTFLRKNLWHALRLQVKKVTPKFAADWYFRLAGYKLPKR